MNYGQFHRFKSHRKYFGISVYYCQKIDSSNDMNVCHKSTKRESDGMPATNYQWNARSRLAVLNKSDTRSPSPLMCDSAWAPFKCVIVLDTAVPPTSSLTLTKCSDYATVYRVM